MKIGDKVRATSRTGTKCYGVVDAITPNGNVWVKSVVTPIGYYICRFGDVHLVDEEAVTFPTESESAADYPRKPVGPLNQELLDMTHEATMRTVDIAVTNVNLAGEVRRLKTELEDTKKARDRYKRFWNQTTFQYRVLASFAPPALRRCIGTACKAAEKGKSLTEILAYITERDNWLFGRWSRTERGGAKLSEDEKDRLAMTAKRLYGIANKYW